MQYLSEDLCGALSADRLFEQVASLNGKVYRAQERRRTFRFELGGRAYFAKVHHGVGWTEIVKNLCQLRLPVLGAGNEWRALQRLADIGVPGPRPVAYVDEGGNPAARRSCIITEALDDTVSLEELCAAGRLEFPVKLRLLRRLAGIARDMHKAGINHRDFYICHFLVKRDTLSQDEPAVYLIDLHRAQLRERTPWRWRVKDIGGLLFSAIDAGIDQKDLLRFVRWYTGKPLRRALLEDAGFWRDVRRRARRLYLQDHPSLPAWVDALNG